MSVYIDLAIVSKVSIINKWQQAHLNKVSF